MIHDIDPPSSAPKAIALKAALDAMRDVLPLRFPGRASVSLATQYPQLDLVAQAHQAHRWCLQRGKVLADPNRFLSNWFDTAAREAASAPTVMPASTTVGVSAVRVSAEREVDEDVSPFTRFGGE